METGLGGYLMAVDKKFILTTAIIVENFTRVLSMAEVSTSGQTAENTLVSFIITLSMEKESCRIEKAKSFTKENLKKG